MANSELGAKQICPNCQSKFYDLGRRPAVCPKCGTQFDPEEAVRNRRIRARAAPADYEQDEEKPDQTDKEAEGFEDDADETPELDEGGETESLEADEEDADVSGAAPAEDLGVDFSEEDEAAEEEDDAVPFLEDEDDDFGDEEIEGLPGEDVGE